jgi:hypothetical protein
LIRAALATMGSGLWGMYSGFELCESAPVPGKEEYLDSEKYEIRPRDFSAPGNIIAEIAQLNRIRRQNPALQTHLGLTLYNAWNDNILYFGKRSEDGSNFILVAVNLDPHQRPRGAFRAALVGNGPAGRCPGAGRRLDERPSLDLVRQNPMDAHRAPAIRHLAHKPVFNQINLGAGKLHTLAVQL